LHGGLLLIAGSVCLAGGVALVITRFRTPTPAIVAVAAVLIVAGFALVANGILALLARSVWTQGTVRDCRPHMLNAVGVRRGVFALDTGASEPFIVPVDAATYGAFAVGDRVRVRHDNFNRARIYAVESVAPDD